MGFAYADPTLQAVPLQLLPYARLCKFVYSFMCLAHCVHCVALHNILRYIGLLCFH